jgi:hypothetical protein
MKLLSAGDDGVELEIVQFLPPVELLDEDRLLHRAGQLPEEESFEIINGYSLSSEKWLGSQKNCRNISHNRRMAARLRMKYVPPNSPAIKMRMIEAGQTIRQIIHFIRKLNGVDIDQPSMIAFSIPTNYLTIIMTLQINCMSF